jgi:hypothetical protein
MLPLPPAFVQTLLCGSEEMKRQDFSDWIGAATTPRKESSEIKQTAIMTNREVDAFAKVPSKGLGGHSHPIQAHLRHCARKYAYRVASTTGSGENLGPGKTPDTLPVYGVSCSLTERTLASGYSSLIYTIGDLGRPVEVTPFTLRQPVAFIDVAQHLGPKQWERYAGSLMVAIVPYHDAVAGRVPELSWHYGLDGYLSEFVDGGGEYRERPFSCPHEFCLPLFNKRGKETGFCRYEARHVRLPNCEKVAIFMVPRAEVALTRSQVSFVARLYGVDDLSVWVKGPGAVNPITKVIGQSGTSYVRMDLQSNGSSMVSFSSSISNIRAVTIETSFLSTLKTRCFSTGLATCQLVSDAYKKEYGKTLTMTQCTTLADVCSHKALGIIEPVNYMVSHDYTERGGALCAPPVVPPATFAARTQASNHESFTKRVIEAATPAVVLNPRDEELLHKSALLIGRILVPDNTRLSVLDVSQAAERYVNNARKGARVASNDLVPPAESVAGSSDAFLKSEAISQGREKEKSCRIINAAATASILAAAGVWAVYMDKIKLHVYDPVWRPFGLLYVGGQNTTKVENAVGAYVSYTDGKQLTNLDFKGYDNSFSEPMERAVQKCVAMAFEDPEEASLAMSSEINMTCTLRTMTAATYAHIIKYDQGFKIGSGTYGTHARGTIGNYIAMCFALLRAGVPESSIEAEPIMLGLCYGDDGVHAYTVDVPTLDEAGEIDESLPLTTFTVNYNESCTLLGLTTTVDPVNCTDGSNIQFDTPAERNVVAFLGRAYPCPSFSNFSVPLTKKRLSKLCVTMNPNIVLGFKVKALAVMQTTTPHSILYVYCESLWKLKGLSKGLTDKEKRQLKPDDHWVLDQTHGITPPFDCIGYLHALEAADLGIEISDYHALVQGMKDAKSEEEFTITCSLHETNVVFEEDGPHTSYLRLDKPSIGREQLCPEAPATFGMRKGEPLVPLLSREMTTLPEVPQTSLQLDGVTEVVRCRMVTAYPPSSSGGCRSSSASTACRSNSRVSNTAETVSSEGNDETNDPHNTKRGRSKRRNKNPEVDSRPTLPNPLGTFASVRLAKATHKDQPVGKAVMTDTRTPGQAKVKSNRGRGKPKSAKSM